MRKLIDRFSSPKGVQLTLEYDTEKDIYILTLKTSTETKVFEGTIEEIQKLSHQYFINSLKELKNQLEITILEQMYKKS